MSKEKVNLSVQTENKQAQVNPGDFGYQPPAELVPLPSCGKLYPADSPLFEKDTVEIFPMTAKEEDILSSRALIKQGKAISTLLKSCIVDKSIDVDKLVIGDRNALLVAIRITGYGREYDAKITCSECSEEQSHCFDLAKLPIKRLKKDPIVNGSNSFSYMLPQSKKEVVFKLLTGADENDIDQTTKRLKKAAGISGQDNTITLRLLFHLISLGGESDRQKLAQIVRFLPASDSRVFRKHIEDISPGIEMLQEVTCGECGNIEEVDVPLGVEFFWPSN